MLTFISNVLREDVVDKVLVPVANSYQSDALLLAHSLYSLTERTSPVSQRLETDTFESLIFLGILIPIHYPGVLLKIVRVALYAPLLTVPLYVS